MSGFLHRMRFRRDHRWAPEHMSDYLDGELDPDARSRFDHHLRECAECRKLLAGLRRTLDALHRLSVPSGAPDPAKLATSVRARLD
jgi:anti-sigma factor RsiW